MNPDFKFTPKQKTQLTSNQQQEILGKHELMKQFTELYKKNKEIEQELSQIPDGKNTDDLKKKAYLHSQLGLINTELAEIKQQIKGCNQEISNENPEPSKLAVVRNMNKQIYDTEIEDYQEKFVQFRDYLKLVEDFKAERRENSLGMDILKGGSTGLEQLDNLITVLNKNTHSNKLITPTEPFPLINYDEMKVISYFLNGGSLMYAKNSINNSSGDKAIYNEILGIFEELGFEDRLTDQEIAEITKKTGIIQRFIPKIKVFHSERESQEYEIEEWRKERSFLETGKEVKWNKNIREALKVFLDRKAEETNFDYTSFKAFTEEVNSIKLQNSQSTFGEIYQQMRNSQPEIIRELKAEKTKNTQVVIQEWQTSLEVKTTLGKDNKIRAVLANDLSHGSEIGEKDMFKTYEEDKQFMSLLQKLGVKEKTQLFQGGQLPKYSSNYGDNDIRFLEKNIAILEAEINKLKKDEIKEINRMKFNNFFSNSLRIEQKETEIKEKFQTKIKEPKNNLIKLQGFLSIITNLQETRKQKIEEQRKNGASPETKPDKLSVIQGIANSLLSEIPQNQAKSIFQQLITDSVQIDLGKETWGIDSLNGASVIVQTEENPKQKMTVGELLTKINQLMIE